MGTKSLLVLFLVLANAFNALLVAQASHKRKYINSGCRFSLMLAENYRMRLAKALPNRPACTFTVLRPRQVRIWLSIHSGTLEQSAKDLGFFRHDDGWTIEGEGENPAEKVDAPSWTGLVGSVAVRQYNQNGYAGIGEETRALLFDRNNRVAEIMAAEEDPELMEFIRGFEFLPLQTPKP